MRIAFVVFFFFFFSPHPVSAEQIEMSGNVGDGASSALISFDKNDS